MIKAHQHQHLQRYKTSCQSNNPRNLNEGVVERNLLHMFFGIIDQGKLAVFLRVWTSQYVQPKLRSRKWTTIHIFKSNRAMDITKKCKSSQSHANKHRHTQTTHFHKLSFRSWKLRVNIFVFDWKMVWCASLPICFESCENLLPMLPLNESCYLSMKLEPVENHMSTMTPYYWKIQIFRREYVAYITATSIFGMSLRCHRDLVGLSLPCFNQPF